jgi:hypothetical protein
MDRLNSHFLRPLQMVPRVISADGQSALVDKLGDSPSRSRLLSALHRLSSMDSTTCLGPQCWDGSLAPSQQPIYNLHIVTILLLRVKYAFVNMLLTAILPKWKCGISDDGRKQQQAAIRAYCTVGLNKSGCYQRKTVSGQGPVAGCCECGDEPLGSCATELVS